MNLSQMQNVRASSFVVAWLAWLRRDGGGG